MESIPATKISRTFDTFVTTGGAQIFRLPLNAFPNFWVYAYLVLVDDYRVLIDTGSGFGDSDEHLENGFRQASVKLGRTIRFEELTHILITHGHIDHFGGLAYLHERTQARIGVHELDLRNLTRYEERIMVVERRLSNFLVEAGVSNERRDEIINIYKLNKALFRSIPVDFTFEALDMRLGPFEMLHVPGHCAGHVVIRLHNVLFSGDHVLGQISPHQAPESLTLYTGLGHYLGSLSLLEKWRDGVNLTLSGHDEPISDLPGRLQVIRQLHADRLGKTLEILSGQGTIADVSKDLFGSVDGYNVLLALEEAGAHVEYLYQRGLLHIVNLDELGESRPVAVRYQCVKYPLKASDRLSPTRLV